MPWLRRRGVRRALIGAGVAIAALMLAGALLYFFGTMQPPSPESRAAYAAEVAAGRMPAVESRFGIPIPGCVCHSDDPVSQVRHSTRRIAECKGCHTRG